jgi:hypothetical protein
LLSQLQYSDVSGTDLVLQRSSGTRSLVGRRLPSLMLPEVETRKAWKERREKGRKEGRRHLLHDNNDLRECCNLHDCIACCNVILVPADASFIESYDLCVALALISE